MFCWKCNGKIEGKAGFRSICPHCSWDLHVCKNCKYYSVGKPRDCSIVDIEPVTDKEKFNFCEEFRFREIALTKNDSSRAEELFGDEAKPRKRDFKSLFKEE